MAFSVEWFVRVPKKLAQRDLELFEAKIRAEIKNAQEIVKLTNGKVWFSKNTNADYINDSPLTYENNYYRLYELVNNYIKEYILNMGLTMKSTKIEIDAKEIIESGLRDKVKEWFANYVAENM